jgi:hypothetical protein
MEYIIYYMEYIIICKQEYCIIYVGDSSLNYINQLLVKLISINNVNIVRQHIFLMIYRQNDKSFETHMQNKEIGIRTLIMKSNANNFDISSD